MRRPPNIRESSWASVVFLIGCLIGIFGCQSTDPAGSPHLASVLISGNTPGQIRDAAIDIFRQNGYQTVQTDSARFVFEKQGSGMNNLAYGNWLGDTPIWIRVKATIVPAGEMTFRLQCSACLVRDLGSASEEELPLSKVHKGKYQKLLEQVAVKFKQK